MKRFLLLLAFVLISNLFFGQGFRRTYSLSNNGLYGRSAIETPDGGYLTVGSQRDTIFSLNIVSIIKTDLKGDTLWTRIDSSIWGVQDVIASDDGGFFLTTGGDVNLIKIDSDGKKIWSKKYGANAYQLNKIKKTKDGAFISVGATATNEFFIVKFNSNGDTLWTKSYKDNSWLEGCYGSSIIQTVDNGFVVIGYDHHRIYDKNYPYSPILIRLDNNGTLQWKRKYSSFIEAGGLSIELTDDNGFFIAGTRRTDNYYFNNLYLMKTNSMGDTLWTKEDSSYTINRYHDFSLPMVKTSDGNFIVAGISDQSFNNHLIKFNENGNIIWNKIPSSGFSNYIYSMKKLNDGNLLICGAERKSPSWQTGLLLMKTNEEGEYPHNTISGKAYIDRNSNCMFDAGDEVLKNNIIKVNNGQSYNRTDDNGDYHIRLDTGIFNVSFISPSDLITPSCPANASYTIILKTLDKDTTGFNFGTRAVDCHLLTVNVSSPRRRRCFKSVTDITYRNERNTKAEASKIYIKYPKYVVPLKINVPWTFDSKDSVYVVSLGNVAAGAEGTFSILDSVICGNESIRNLTQCVKVWITPSSNCIPIDPDWDKSNITVKGSCINGQYSIFTIKNEGEENMKDSSYYYLYYNESFVSGEQFRLMAGKSIEVKAPANGQTVRLEAYQTSKHPGKSRPSAFAEACGVNSEGKFSTGYVNLFRQDDSDPNVAITCSQIVDSYDPNDKHVSPEGFEANHYVKPGIPLEFTIRFQNMGSDTAYNVRVLDTLMTKLDISTLKVTGSSHSYRFDIAGQEKPVLIFTFSNINLPHKAQNDLGSNGYIKFEVNPLATIPLETEISNYADIYFDYNSPVRTNKAWVTISNKSFSNTQLLKNICAESHTSLADFFEVFCISDAPFMVTGGIPAGGTYSGNGISNGKFDPKTAGEGTHTITYTYTAPNSCSSSSSKTITVNTCTGTEKDLFAQQFLIYPSPAKEKLMIASRQSLAKQVKVEVFSTVGIKCAEANFNGTETSFDVSNYPKGIYILRISEGNNSLIRKFMKE